MIDRHVGAELPRPRELVVARRRHDRPRAERLRDREARRRDAAADSPQQHPLALEQVRARDEHPVRGLEHERERGRLLEGEIAGNGVDVRRGHGDQLRVRAVAVLADHVDRPVRSLDAGVEHDALSRLEAGHAGAERLDDARAVRAQDARLRHRRQALPDPDVEMVQRGGADPDEHLALACGGIRSLLQLQHLGAAVRVDTHRLHTGQTIGVNAAHLRELAEELGLDAVGAAPAAPYEETERHIRDRRARGLFADMRFTMSRPEESCHPETLLPGARTVVSAALCYYAPEPERPAGHGRLPRYTWFDGYAELREKLDELGTKARWLVPRARRREPARRPRGGCAQRRRLLRQEHAADHAPPRLVGRAGDARDGSSSSSRRRRSTSTAARAASASTRARPARSTSPACSTRRVVSPTGRRRRPRSPSRTAWVSTRRSTAATFARTCARGTAGSRSAATASCREPRQSRTCRSSTGCRRTPASSAAATAGSTCRATTAAGCAATRSSPPGNVGGEAERTAVEPYLEDGDEMLREHAAWALSRMEARGALSGTDCSASARSSSGGLVSERELEGWLSWARGAGLIFATLEISMSSQEFPPGYAAAAWAVTGVLAVGTVMLFVLARRGSDDLGRGSASPRSSSTPPSSPRTRRSSPTSTEARCAGR